MKFLYLLLLCLVAGEVMASDSTNWPDHWMRSYERFKAFKSSHNAFWPKTSIETNKSKHITSFSINDYADAEKSTIEYYHRGYRILTSGRALNSQIAYSKFFPDTYIVAHKIVSPIGYQHCFPLHQVEIKSTDKRLVAEQVESVSDPNHFWPNEQGLLFYGFNLSPSGHLADIYEGPQKVENPISLKIDEDLIIHTEFSPATEGFESVRWRLYRNGQLIHTDPLQAIPKEIHYGPGWYVIHAVIEGDDGYMIVSNPLEFYAHPDGSATGSLIPEDNDGDQTPDYLESFFAFAECLLKYQYHTFS
ncbi:MAG: hypothetical protein AAF212_02800 [Verrucomicrobiota bacterium]